MYKIINKYYVGAQRRYRAIADWHLSCMPDEKFL